MLADKLEWILFVILTGLALRFMFGGDGDSAIQKYMKEETTYMVSSKQIEELPTFLVCFHLKVKRDYDIYGKDFRISYTSSVVSSTYR